MKKEELIGLVPNLAEEDVEKILGLYEEKILEKNAEYENAMAELEDKFAKKELDRMIFCELEKTNPKSIDVLKALLDEGSIVLENGELKGLSEQLECLRESYEFLFYADEEKPKFTKQTKSLDAEIDLKNLSYKDRLKLYSEMPEVYNQLVK